MFLKSQVVKTATTFVKTFSELTGRHIFTKERTKKHGKPKKKGLQLQVPWTVN